MTASELVARQPRVQFPPFIETLVISVVIGHERSLIDTG